MERSAIHICRSMVHSANVDSRSRNIMSTLENTCTVNDHEDKSASRLQPSEELIRAVKYGLRVNRTQTF